MVEKEHLFESHDAERELNARFERSGRRWRFVGPERIELHIPTKTRSQQTPCHIGLFDTDTLSQVDLSDLFNGGVK